MRPRRARRAGGSSSRPRPRSSTTSGPSMEPAPRRAPRSSTTAATSASTRKHNGRAPRALLRASLLARAGLGFGRAAARGATREGRRHAAALAGIGAGRGRPALSPPELPLPPARRGMLRSRCSFEAAPGVPMKIAIDARKWRDYGIGTYVRNLVRHLAHLDRETTYFLFCDRADEADAARPGRELRPRRRRLRAATACRSTSRSPCKLRRLGADLLHSPHYVLPLLCRQRSVVTIHDCIHLLFPEYLPNRMAPRYARAMMGSAIRRSDLVLTVSEASRRDILALLPATPTPSASRWCRTRSTRPSSRTRARRRWSACASATRSAGASCSTPGTSSRTRTSSG